MRNLRDYLWAETTSEALRLLREHGGRGALLAGGTCLAVRDDPGLDFVVDLGRLGLDRISADETTLRIGALVSLQALSESRLVRSCAGGLLADAAAKTRTEPWRRQATLGGRLLEADPADLLLPCCLVLEARARVLCGPESLPEWMPLEPALAPRATPALLLEVEIPRSPRAGFALEWLARSELDAPLGAIAAAVECESGRVRGVRIATSGLGPAPCRAPHAEAALLGRAPDAESFGAAQAALDDDMSPRGDHRASAEYRAHLARVLLARALRRAVERAENFSTE